MKNLFVFCLMLRLITHAVPSYGSMVSSVSLPYLDPRENPMLATGEVVYVRQTDGYFTLRIGDGQTAGGRPVFDPALSIANIPVIHLLPWDYTIEVAGSATISNGQITLMPRTLTYNSNAVGTVTVHASVLLKSVTATVTSKNVIVTTSTTGTTATIQAMHATGALDDFSDYLYAAKLYALDVEALPGNSYLLGRTNWLTGVDNRVGDAVVDANPVPLSQARSLIAARYPTDWSRFPAAEIARAALGIETPGIALLDNLGDTPWLYSLSSGDLRLSYGGLPAWTVTAQKDPTWAPNLVLWTSSLTQSNSALHMRIMSGLATPPGVVTSYVQIAASAVPWIESSTLSSLLRWRPVTPTSVTPIANGWDVVISSPATNGVIFRAKLAVLGMSFAARADFNTITATSVWIRCVATAPSNPPVGYAGIYCDGTNWYRTIGTNAWSAW